MDCSIKKFSHFLVVKYSEMSGEDSNFKRSFDEFLIHENSKEIFECIDSLLKHYGDITNKISIKEFEEKFLCSKRQYLEQLLSRCLKLSEDDLLTFHDFLIVCVYISKFSELLLKKRQCYKVLKLTANCLEAVYCRKYKNYFNDNKGFQGFADYCGEVNEGLTFVKVEDLEGTAFLTEVDGERNKKMKNLECLKDIEEIVSLNSMEGRFLCYSACFFAFSSKDEDFLIDLNSVGGTDQDMEMEGWHFVPVKPSKLEPCRYCLSKCFQYFNGIVFY